MGRGTRSSSLLELGSEGGFQGTSRNQDRAKCKMGSWAVAWGFAEQGVDLVVMYKASGRRTRRTSERSQFSHSSDQWKPGPREGEAVPGQTWGLTSSLQYPPNFLTPTGPSLIRSQMASLTFSGQGWCHKWSAGLRVGRLGLCSRASHHPALQITTSPEAEQVAAPHCLFIQKTASTLQFSWQ